MIILYTQHQVGGKEGGLTSALVSHVPQTPTPVYGVCHIQQRCRRHQKADPGKRNLSIKVVIRQIHPLFRIRLLEVWWPLLRAGKIGVGGTEWGFPDLAEFIQDVGDLGLVGVVIHEYDCPLLREDELGQRGPVVNAHGDFGRGVSPFRQARGFEGLGVVAHANEIRVTDEDGDNVVRVCGDPLGDVCEVI